MTETYIYMNHAGVAPLSRRVQAAMTGFIADATLNGAVNAEQWAETAEMCRAAAAQPHQCRHHRDRIHEEYNAGYSYRSQRY